MKLSIVTPVFNEAERIKPFLDSLKNQTEKPELVIVDGGSKDGTIKLIKQYQKKMNINIYFEKGKLRSPANARNIGITKAKGNMVVVADADAFFEKDFTRKLVTAFKENKENLISFDVVPLKFKKFESWIQRAYYYRDASRWKQSQKAFFYRKRVTPKYIASLGYGEDKLVDVARDKLMKTSYKHLNKKISFFQLGPVSLVEVFKRYAWYGRTIPYYLKESKENVTLLKYVLAILSIPFFPLMIIPMVRGLIYALREVKEYPLGIITIPFLEALSFPFMAIGFWQYLLGKSKVYKGH